MRNIIAIISTAVLLSACALFPSTFDSNEQARITNIILLSQDDSVCSRGDVSTVVQEINYHAQWLKVYSASIPRNDKIIVMSKNLADVTNDFHNNYKKDKAPSQFYCKAKIKIIQNATTQMLEVSGRRPRI